MEQNRGHKKILFLLSRFLDGGIDTVLVEYLSFLAKNPEYEIGLAVGLAMGPLEVYRNRVPKNVKVIHLISNELLVHWHKAKIEHGISSWKKDSDELFLNPIRRYLIRRRLHRLCQEYTTVIDFDCCFYSYLKKVPVYKVAYFHFSFAQMMKESPRRMKRIARCFKYYDKIVTISQAMWKEGVELFPDVKDKMCVIYNGKDKERVEKMARKLPDNPLIDEPYMIAVERLEESQKDISTILRAYKILCDKWECREKLYIIGKGHSENELKELAETLGIGSRIVFLGFQSNPYPWIARSALLVHGAKFEGLPTVLIEGLMLGKLMVASDCPTGPAEILDNGKAGLLVPVGDAQRMADAMHQLLSNQKLACQMKLCIEKQVHKFSLAGTAKLFDSIVV